MLDTQQLADIFLVDDCLLCLQVERKLEEVEQQLQQQSSNPKDAQDQQQLTPRPTDWGQAQQLADACKVCMACDVLVLSRPALALEHGLRCRN